MIDINKTFADDTIKRYIHKIYGFSLTRTMNIDLAEELASNITYEVYKSFLKSSNIANIDGFVWKIACNVYSQFVARETNCRATKHLPREVDEPEIEEQIERLRYEIAFLSKIQREVIVLHYFDKLKIFEIAQRLEMSLGTVKWHLHQARNTLKELYLYEEESKISPQKPVFTEMINLGYIGGWGIQMDKYFQRNFSQNIAFAAYYEAKTSVEIAKELAVPVVFVEDEIKFLCENGFMVTEPNNKYRTNFCIIRPVEEDYDRVKKYAKIVCDMYIPLLNPKSLAKYIDKTIYTPDNDINFLLWSIVTFACSRKIRTIDERTLWHKYFVKRPDGGEYIAIAKIDKDQVPQKESLYKGMDSICYGDFIRYPIETWQFHSKFDERKYAKDTARYPLFETFYDFISGKLHREPAQIDKYKHLFDKGLIVFKGDTEIANVVVSNVSIDRFEEMLPDMPDTLQSIAKELDEEIFQERKSLFPAYLQDIGRALTINSLAGSAMRVAILENLLDNKILKPLKKHQRMSVNTIMFCDTLPKRG